MKLFFANIVFMSYFLLFAEQNQPLRKLTRTEKADCNTGWSIKQEDGTDSNNNGILDLSEVETTKSICTENIQLTKITPKEKANCRTGYAIYKEDGTDINNNGILDLSEVETEKFITCIDDLVFLSKLLDQRIENSSCR